MLDVDISHKKDKNDFPRNCFSPLDAGRRHKVFIPLYIMNKIEGFSPLDAGRRHK